MKTRPVIIGFCLMLCAASIAGVAVQARRLDSLRAEARQLQLEIQPVETNGVETGLSTSPSSELLRLRNQVSMLSRRQRELAAVPAENERFRARFAEARTNATSTLPPGYIRKSEARFVGYATPEDTLQSILWAMQHHDLKTMLASVTPATALVMQQEMQKEVEQTGKSVEQILQEQETLPGMNVVGRNTKTYDLIELRVEIMPGDVQPLVFRQINGEWKMDSR